MKYTVTKNKEYNFIQSQKVEINSNDKIAIIGFALDELLKKAVAEKWNEDGFLNRRLKTIHEIIDSLNLENTTIEEVNKWGL